MALKVKVFRDPMEPCVCGHARHAHSFRDGCCWGCRRGKCPQFRGGIALVRADVS